MSENRKPRRPVFSQRGSFKADGYNKNVVNGPLGTFQQDMAILLFNGADFPEKNIIELASTSDGLFTNEMVTISGWGKTECEYVRSLTR